VIWRDGTYYLINPQPIIVQGYVSSEKGLIVLQASNGWYPETCASPSGEDRYFLAFVHIESEPNKDAVTADVLNSHKRIKFVNAAFDVPGALPKDIKLAERDLEGPSGLIVFSDSQRHDITFVIENFFLPVFLCCHLCPCAYIPPRPVPCPSPSPPPIGRRLMEPLANKVNNLVCKFLPSAFPQICNNNNGCHIKCSTPCKSKQEFCNKNKNMWTCIEKPVVCPAIVRYVCGCNGVTYINDCFRQQHGVSSSKPGQCDTTKE